MFSNNVKLELLDSCGDSARGRGYPSLEPQCHSLGEGFTTPSKLVPDGQYLSLRLEIFQNRVGCIQSSS